MNKKTIRVKPVDLKDRIIQINRSKGSIKRFEEYMSNARRFMQERPLNFALRDLRPHIKPRAEVMAIPESKGE